MKTVLIVEDNPKIAKAMTIRLKHHGYSVRVANDAPSALMMARNHEPDVAVLDISIPGGNGLDTAENMQLNVCEKHLPLIFVTASKDPELKQRASSLNAVAFLEKPFSSTELIIAIDTALSQTSGDMHVTPAMGY